MAEIGGANIELAHKLNEGEEHAPQHKKRWHELLEILEAIVLAMVAIATAWSGYQAAQWDGLQDEYYEQSTRLRVTAQGLNTTAGQEHVYDAATVVEWIKAEAAGNHKLAELFRHRVLPGFRGAFDAWVKTDPINNPDAPAGPALMPGYHNADTEKSAELSRQAVEAFDKGSKARGTSDKYVRVTVLLATVLLLTAISQRFRIHEVRLGLGILAFLLLCIPLYRLLGLPRL